MDITKIKLTLEGGTTIEFGELDPVIASVLEAYAQARIAAHNACPERA